MPTMSPRKTRATTSELAKKAGADERPSSRLAFLRSVLKKWSARPAPPSGLVMLAGKDAPRDLDNPLSDPKVQARVGEAISQGARRPRN